MKQNNYDNAINKDEVNLLSNTDINLTATINNCIKLLTKIDSNFSLNNYEFVDMDGNSYSNVETNEIQTTGYITAIYKIGEFKTNCGYIFTIENNFITGVYDSDNKLAKKYILENKDYNFYNISSSDFLNCIIDGNYYNKTIDELKDDAINKVKIKYINNEIKIIDYHVEFYLNVQEAKKYVKINVGINLNNDADNVITDSIYTEIE